MQVTTALHSLALEQSIEPVTRKQYERSVRSFQAYLARPAMCEDLTPDNFNRWLLWLADEKGLGPVSVRNYRSGLLRVWNYAHATLGVVGACPIARIRRPKAPTPIVKAWTLSDFAILLEAAAGLSGYLRCGIPASDFLTAWLWVGYETGLRPGDMRLMTWDSVS